MTNQPIAHPTVRVLAFRDLDELLRLYVHLHGEDAFGTPTEALRDQWRGIVDNPAHAYVGAFVIGSLRSVANLTLVPNLTRGARPFGVVENVVTHPAYRRLGLASSVMTRIVEVCAEAGCYKVMLLSAAERVEAHAFYRSLGFDGDSKRAFVRRF